MASECSVCGRKTETSLVLIEGAKVLACGNCAGFGKAIASSRKAVVFEKPVETFKELHLIDGYGNVIRIAREKLGFSQEELARKLALNLQLLQQIESQKLKPQEAIGKRLEEFLKIKLYTYEAPKDESKGTSQSRDLTLADIVQFKKK